MLTPRSHNLEIQDAIVTQTTQYLESIQIAVLRSKIETAKECRGLVSEVLENSRVTPSLTWECQLELIEQYAKEYDLHIDDMAIETLPSQIEWIAAEIVEQLSKKRFIEFLNDLDQFMRKNGFNCRDARSTNIMEHMKHVSERSIGDSCTVYTYQSDDLVIDVFEVTCASLCKVYFKQTVAHVG